MFLAYKTPTNNLIACCRRKTHKLSHCIENQQSKKTKQSYKFHILKYYNENIKVRNMTKFVLKKVLIAVNS